MRRRLLAELFHFEGVRRAHFRFLRALRRRFWWRAASCHQQDNKADAILLIIIFLPSG
jgi:hypothetical protein